MRVTTTGLHLEQANLLRAFVRKLESSRGELAEVLKSEAQARAEAYQNSPDTRVQGREQYSSAMSVDNTTEVIDMKADVRSLEIWVEFWTLIIKHDIPLSPTGEDYEAADYNA